MGMNFYVDIKRKYDESLVDAFSKHCCSGGYYSNDVEILTNGYVWRGTFYKTMEEVNDVYCLNLHIGKSSMGWHFGLCVYPSLGINNLDDWIKLWNSPNVVIADEEGRTITPQEMVDRITKRGRPDWDDSKREEFEKKAVDSYNLLNASLGNHLYINNYEEYLREYHAIRGLNGLLAHSSPYYNYPPTGGTYDLTDDPDFS